MPGKVLIIDALSAGRGQRTSSRDSIGCGPRSVAGVFEKYRIPCRIVRAEVVLAGQFKLRSFDHLAISAMSMDFPATKRLVDSWKKRRKQGRIMIGGPIATDADRLLREINPDLIVRGEGEATLSELINIGFLENDVQLEHVLGIAYRKGKAVKVNDPRPFLSPEELSKEYHPSTSRIIDYPYYQASKVYVEVLRGCSNFNRTRLELPDGRMCSDCGNCDSDKSEDRVSCPEDIPPGCGFCSVPAVWGPPRSKMQNTIIEEVEELLDLGVRRIVLEAPGFFDYMRGGYPVRTPCSPKPNVNAIRLLLEKISEIKQMQSGEAHLSIENVKACLLNDDTARILSEFAGMTSPNIGLETGSARHMRDIGKCGTPEDIVRAVKISSKYGLRPHIYFIYGLPGETPKTVEESIRLMREVSEAGAERIILYGFRPLPESAFAEARPSSAKDPLGMRLKKEAARINRSRKTEYVGKIMRGIAAEPSGTHHGFTMVYPLNEGPLMTVRGGFSPGTLLCVRIFKVLSEGLVEGEVIQNKE